MKWSDEQRHERYLQKAQKLIGERIDSVRESFNEDWTGDLIGGGRAVANARYDPRTRTLIIDSFRPGAGEASGLVEIEIGS